MQDRIPTAGQEGRVLITPEDGSPAYYAKISMADNPTQEGTAYDKSNVLQDVTCDAIGIPHTSTPNDAFLALAIGLGRYGYIVHLQYPDGTPAEGFSLSGLYTSHGTPAITDANGNAFGISADQSVSLTVISPYIDISNNEENIVSTGILTTSIITVYPKSEYTQISDSGNYKVSPLVETYDLTAIGGGAGGQQSSSYITGAGGGGGQISTVLNIDAIAFSQFSVQIGACGKAVLVSAASPTQAGSTIVKAGDVLLVSAAGGFSAYYDNYSRGGSGNGKGGDNTSPNGEPASGYLFDETDLGIPGGGGGGYGQNGIGGSPYGGNGANSRTSQSAESGKGPGGGGGGGVSGGTLSSGADGANGAVFFRAHYPT